MTPREIARQNILETNAFVQSRALSEKHGSATSFGMNIGVSIILHHSTLGSVPPVSRMVFLLLLVTSALLLVARSY